MKTKVRLFHTCKKNGRQHKPFSAKKDKTKEEFSVREAGKKRGLNKELI